MWVEGRLVQVGVGCDHLRGVRCTGEGQECDHADDDWTNNTLSNLLWKCSACHQRKTLLKAQRAKQAKRDAAKHSSARLQHPGLR